MNFYQSYYTDVGTTRATNQDSLALIKAETEYGDVLLAILCDGMGGHALGELASKICVTGFAEWFKKSLPYILYDETVYEQRIRFEWQRLVEGLNETLAEYGDRNNTKLGSTLTAALFIGEELFIAHVGDSRCYEIREGVRQLTRDHSLVAAIERGEVRPEPGSPPPKRNVLTESVGITHRVNMDFCCTRVNPGATYLICSDGFWHNISDGELVRYFASDVIGSNKILRMHLNFLVEQAKLRGEADNISAVAVVPSSTPIQT